MGITAKLKEINDEQVQYVDPDEIRSITETYTSQISKSTNCWCL